MKDDLARLVDRVFELEPNILPSRDAAWSRSSASKVIDCVLSLMRRYDAFVVPRVQNFERRYPEVKSVAALHALISSYDNPYSFSVDVLDYRDHGRANTLAALVAWLNGNVTKSQHKDSELLASWAVSAPVDGYKSLMIRGIGIAGWQYLRMLFGADTSKPDVHIIRFVENAIGKKLSASSALSLLQEACETAGVSLGALDKWVWETSARNASPAKSMVKNLLTKPRNNGIQGLSHITFIVRDLDKMSAIITQVFDGEVVYASGDATFSTSREKFFVVGGIWIAIMEGDPLPTRTYNHVAFKVSDEQLTAASIAATKLGLDIRPPRPRVDGEGQSLYFHDYDNHLFELHTGTLEERLVRYSKG